MLQVAAAAAAASEMLGQAAAISAALEAEEHLRQIQAGLRDQEEQANDAVKVWPCLYLSLGLCQAWLVVVSMTTAAAGMKSLVTTVMSTLYCLLFGRMNMCFMRSVIF